ncbi:MAG: DUF4230 domain-containing protein [Chloroflexi bacterium]|nr:DUF4230 domain-containing protein [Chloroflexota bacterium]
MADVEPTPQTDNQRLILSIVLGAIFLAIMVVAFLIVNRLASTAEGAAELPNAVATDVNELINPTPTIFVDPVTVVLQVQSLSRLETAAYTIEKVITAENGEGALGFLFRDRLLLVAQGEVIAGVDLSRLDEDDIRIADETVYMTLPAAEIFVATLDNDETYIYDRQTAVLGQQIDLETLARQEAEQAILDAAIEDGILSTAQDNAEQSVASLLNALGFTDIVFIEATPAPDQDRGP